MSSTFRHIGCIFQRKGRRSLHRQQYGKIVHHVSSGSLLNDSYTQLQHSPVSRGPQIWKLLICMVSSRNINMLWKHDFINHNILGLQLTSIDWNGNWNWNRPKLPALFSRNYVYSSRANNWLVDTGSDPMEHNGLSYFDKVRTSPCCWSMHGLSPYLWGYRAGKYNPFFFSMWRRDTPGFLTSLLTFLRSNTSFYDFKVWL